MFDFDQLVLIRILGFGFLLMGLAARFGFWKKWYWRSRGGVYLYMPMGLMFILYTYEDQINEGLGSYDFILIAVMVLLAIFCVWWSARTPAFIKPTWVRWIDKYPKRVRKAMVDEVEAGEEWEKLVESELFVDQWAKRLSAKQPKRPKSKKRK